MSGCIVLPLVDGEFSIKSYLVRERGILLHAGYSVYSDIVISEGCEFEVWGVITRPICMF